jgi:ribosomal protein S18 acetylase RimI-like enzyme
MRPLVAIAWGWDDAFQVQFFRDHHQPERLQVIELDGRPVGVIGHDIDAKRLYIGPYEVLPAFQGQGIGTAAMREVIAIGNAAGVPAELQVLKINTKARRLYERLGFETFELTETHHLMRRPVSPIGPG